MIIYGVALLAFCTVAGLFLGSILGNLLGVQANVGGVGIAMILLLWLQHVSQIKFKLYDLSKGGITFWSAMYIPIVVAMAAKQDVVAAVSGGPIAIIAGVLAVVASFALIPIMTKWALHGEEPTYQTPEEGQTPKEGEDK